MAALQNLVLVSMLIYRAGSQEQTQNWLNSSKICNLVEKSGLISHFHKEIWITGVFTLTSWMTYKGCYWKQDLDENSTESYAVSSNSPIRCSLKCTHVLHFALKENVCYCMSSINNNKVSEPNCDRRCSDNMTFDRCGSSDAEYLSVYRHNIIPSKIQDEHYLRNCIVAKKVNDSIQFRAVNCSDKHTVVCKVSTYGLLNLSEMMTFDNANKVRLETPCEGIQSTKDSYFVTNAPNMVPFWTVIRRYTLLILNNQSEVQHHIEKGSNIHRECTNKTRAKRKICDMPFRCCTTTPSVCDSTTKTLVGRGLTHDFVSDHAAVDSSTAPTEDLKKSNEMEHQSENDSILSFGTTPRDIITSTTVQSTEEFTELTTILIDTAYIATTDNTKDNDTNHIIKWPSIVFAIQIGFAVVVSVFIILMAVLAGCARREKRGQDVISYGVSSNNRETPVVENPNIQNRSSCRMADDYSCPWDARTLQSEIKNVLPDTSGACLENQQNKDKDKDNTNQYHHLDFTLRSEKAPNFLSGGEYGVPRTRLASVFDQPWDSQTSKVSKLFSQLRQSVVKHGREIHNSLLQRETSTRRNHDDVNDPGSDIAMNNIALLRDAPKQQTNNDLNSRENPNTHDENDMSCTDLTHMYAEPVDKRLSMRERVIKFVSTKFPFGINNAYVESPKQHSKLQSGRYSIEEVIESEV